MQQNEKFRGIITGICLPIVVFAVCYGIYYMLENSGLLSASTFSENFRIRTLSIVAIASNAVLINLFTKRRQHESARFVIFPTFAYVVAWLIMFLKDLL